MDLLRVEIAEPYWDRPHDYATAMRLAKAVRDALPKMRAMPGLRCRISVPRTGSVGAECQVSFSLDDGQVAMFVSGFLIDRDPRNLSQMCERMTRDALRQLICARVLVSDAGEAAT